MPLEQTIASVRLPDPGLREAARHKMDFKTKPLGSLGRLEDAAVRLCQMQNSLEPALARRSLVVFAGDHGVAAAGVSAFPAEVTPQMVHNFLAGGAAINVLCRQQGISLRVADLGVNADFAPHPQLIDAKVRRGTRNFLVEPALTREETRQALEMGIMVFERHIAAGHPDIVAMGEMGIGNSSSAAALIAAVCGRTAAEVTGRGTGLDDAGLARKQAAVARALDLHRPDPANGLDLLSKVGGLEIAGMAGFALAAAAAGVPVVLDGLISTAAGLVAAVLCPAVSHWFFSGHRSVEIGQAIALERLGLVPLIDLDLRLGEGTGAALAINILDAACRIMVEMASFESAGVSGKS
jgi:nicotinate-nucleotide--dimethylbenzimidazole phosphoribosyltransferase